MIDNLDFDALIVGDSNEFDIDILGDDVVDDLDIDGDSNDITIDQAAFTAGVSNGHMITLDVTGDSNTITLDQQAANAQNIIELEINGSSGTWSVTQQ